MPFGFVRLSGPAGRDVYVNGNYQDIGGQTGDDFAVQYGFNTFETLDDESRIDFRVRVEVTDDNPRVDADLEPVEPPEPTALTPDDDSAAGGA